MAARRGKSQARRNQGNGGLPGWAWGVIGLLVGIVLILAVPTLLKSDGDGFFRPRPNPDAQPEPVAIEDDVVAPDDAGAEPRDKAKSADEPASGGSKRADYDFYTLLPGKEVALSDAELAATERVENQRAAQAEAATTATAATTPVTSPLPSPVDGRESPAPTATKVAVAVPVTKPTPAAAAAVPVPATDNTRYLLQAGAFQASGQAEELKARIALLGLGARVESASIGGKTVYRVRMGPYGTAGELAEAKRKLATGGLPGMAIKVQ